MNGIRSFVPPILRTVALLLMVFMAGVVMLSAQTESSAPAKKKATTTAAKQSKQNPTYNTNAGQKIYIDPVTKQIVQPTAEDIQALQNAIQADKGLRLAAPAIEPQQFVTPDGVIGVVLPEDTMSYAVATKTADGKLVMGCVDSKDKAEAAVKPSAKRAPAKKEARDEQ